MGTMAEALARYEDEHEFARQFLLPEEGKLPYIDAMQGGYRWFRSSNVVCLEKYRLLNPSVE
jgi:hypothetical protein